MSYKKIALLDTETGERVEITTEADSFYWAEGNGSCDCNRELHFGRDTSEGYCLGEKRYLIVKSTYKDYDLDELNAGYPEELKKKFIGETKGILFAPGKE